MSDQKTRGKQTQSAGFLYIANNVRKNLLRIYRNWKWQTSHLYLFPVCFVYWELLLRAFSGSFFPTLFYPLIFGLGCGVLFAAVTSFFAPKVNRTISLVLLYVTALLFTVECQIRGSYQVYMTPAGILAGAGGVLTGFGGEFLAAVFNGLPKIFLFFLPALLYTVTGKRRVPARRYQKPFVAILLVAALLITGVGTLTVRVGKNSAKYKEEYDFNTSIQTFGLTTGLRLGAKYDLFGKGSGGGLELEETVEENSVVEDSAVEEVAKPKVYRAQELDINFKSLAEEEYDETIKNMHSYVDSVSSTMENPYTGLFEGKNLILICAEAFSDVVIDPELTPTLYRLTHNGFYFSDFYQPAWGGSTSTGEFSFLFGIAPMNGIQTIVDSSYCNNYFTMGNQLQREGYYSAAFHNGDYNYYDRDLTHQNLGYSTWTARGNGLENLTDDYADTPTFDATLATYIDKQPFSIYYMSLSGHSVYRENRYSEEFYDTVKARYGDQYKDTTLYYFCHQMEFEKALTSMVSKLEEAGIADDTVICICSDHYPYGLEKNDAFSNTEDYVSDLYGYTPEHCWERDRNALIIWSGCLENEYKDMACEISEPTYSLDIVPTLSNLFGLEYDSRLLVGRDVFSSAEPLVLWNEYSWITEKGKYDGLKSEFYPNEGVTIPEGYVERIQRTVRNKLVFSEQVINYDYYGILFGPDVTE